MRRYAPASVETVLERLLQEPSLARGVAHHAVVPARPAETADVPAWLDPRIRSGLAASGIERLYATRRRRSRRSAPVRTSWS